VQLGYPNSGNCLNTDDTGSLNVASGQLEVGGTNFHFEPGSTVTGAAASLLVFAGTVELDGATTSIPVPLAITGTVTGSGNLTVSDSLAFNGELNTSAATTVASGATLTMTGGTVITGSLVNDGSATIAANDGLNVAAGATFSNAGQFAMQVGSYLAGGCGQPATATQPAIPNGEFASSGSITTNGTTSTAARRCSSATRTPTA
jgi:phage baseplate assembly protein gpV